MGLSLKLYLFFVASLFTMEIFSFLSPLQLPLAGEARLPTGWTRAYWFLTITRYPKGHQDVRSADVPSALTVAITQCPEAH